MIGAQVLRRVWSPRSLCCTYANSPALPTVGPRSAHRLPSHNSKTVLLSGANPRIAKGDGDAHVQSHIAAMPGWKSAIGRGLTGNDIPRLKNGL